MICTKYNGDCCKDMGLRAQWISAAGNIFQLEILVCFISEWLPTTTCLPRFPSKLAQGTLTKGNKETKNTT